MVTGTNSLFSTLFTMVSVPVTIIRLSTLVMGNTSVWHLFIVFVVVSVTGTNSLFSTLFTMVSVPVTVIRLSTLVMVKCSVMAPIHCDYDGIGACHYFQPRSLKKSVINACPLPYVCN